MIVSARRRRRAEQAAHRTRWAALALAAGFAGCSPATPATGSNTDPSHGSTSEGTSTPPSGSGTGPSSTSAGDTAVTTSSDATRSSASASSADGGAGDASVGTGADSGAIAKDGGVQSCAQTHYLICEDFESTSVGAVPAGWQRSCLYGGANCVPPADVAVAADEAYESAHSLKLGVSGGSDHYRTISTSGAVLGSGHWGRIFYKVQVPVPAYFAHDTFVNLQGKGPTDGDENVRVIDTVQNANHTHQFLYNVQAASGEFGKGSAYDYHFDDNMWHCAEYHLDNPSQSYHFFLDGAEVTSIAFDSGAGNYGNSQIPAVITTIGVGLNQYQSPPAGQAAPQWFTVWIDNVAFDTNRIGCH